MVKLTIVNILGQPNDILGLKKQFDNCGRGFTEYYLEGYENCADHLSNNLRLNEISKLTFFPILLQNKQKPVRDSCKRNLWSTPSLVLRNIEFKIWRNKPGDEAFRVSFKFSRRE